MSTGTGATPQRTGTRGSARTKKMRTLPAALLESLEQRLDLLTRSLNTSEIAEKSIDIVREIKELHGILRSLGVAAQAEAQPERKLVVVWGQSEKPSSSAATRPLRSKSRAGSSALSTAAAATEAS